VHAATEEHLTGSDTTILDLYRHEVEAPRDGHYTHWVPGGRRTLATGEFLGRTAAIASWLAERGVGRGDRVMLLSDNRPEWHMVDLAVLSLGAVDVPVYTTLTRSQIAYQVSDSGATVAFAENAELMDRFLSIRGECPGLGTLVQIEGEAPRGAIGLDAVGGDGDAGAFWQRASGVGAGDLATIVYTSGTTGDPKGVMLSHGNFVANVLAAVERAPIGREDHVLEFLPLSHVLERCVGYAYMLRACTRSYCSAHHVADLIAEVRPTAFVSVPRLYEKIHARVMGMVQEAPPLRRRIFGWAVGRGLRAGLARLEGLRPGPLDRLAHAIADRLVLGKVRERMGGRVRYTLSGGAPLPVHVAEFFHAIGVPVYEGYGLTETSPAITLSGYRPGQTRLGSVGRPLGNLEVRIAPDGELLVRGPSVMGGYWNKPAETAGAFDADGFFMTGDIARIDDDGFVYITDRKKDLIVTSGGKNVAPQPIEAELLESRYVEHAVLLGDGRPYVTALIGPDAEAVGAWARARGLGDGDPATLPEVTGLIGQVVETVNANRAPFERVRKFRLLPVAPSVENGYLTPTMKVRRRLIERDFADLVEEMYA
jgi:long-chain acyl-CoA synthetase